MIVFSDSKSDRDCCPMRPSALVQISFSNSKQRILYEATSVYVTKGSIRQGRLTDKNANSPPLSPRLSVQVSTSFLRDFVGLHPFIFIISWSENHLITFNIVPSSFFIVNVHQKNLFQTHKICNFVNPRWSLL